MGATSQVTVFGNLPTQLIAAGDGPTLLFNSDPTNSVYLGDTQGMNANNTATFVPLPSLASVVYDGTSDVFALSVSTTTQSIVYKLPGAVNFFQLVELLLKTLIISASVGNGIFTYTPTASAGNLFSWLTAPGTTEDPFGDPLPNDFGGFGIQSGGIISQLLAGALEFSTAASAVAAFINFSFGASVQSIAIGSGNTSSGDQPAVIQITSGDSGLSPAVDILLNSAVVFELVAGTGQFAQLTLALTLTNGLTITSGGINVTGSITGHNGVNSYILSTGTDGHPTFSREIEISNIGAAPSAPATGIKIYALGGKAYIIGLDGNNESVGELRLVGTTVAQLINSTSFTPVAGLSCTLEAGFTYEIEGKILLEGVAAAAGNPEFQFNGTVGIGTMHITGLFYPETGATISINGANAGALAASMIGQILSITATQVFKFEGIVTPNATGTFHLDAACSAAVDTFDVFGTKSYMNVKQQ